MKPSSARRLRRVSLAIAGTLLIIIGALAWLLGTASGARFAIGFLEDALPVTFGEVSGSLMGTLELANTVYRDGDTEVVVDRAVIAVAPGVLWNFRRVEITTLVLDGVRVSLPASDDAVETVSADVILPELPAVSLPIRVSVRDSQFSNVSLTKDGALLVSVTQSHMVGAWSGTQISLETLSVDTPQGGVQLNGDVDLNRMLELDVALNWRLRDGDTETAAGQLTLSGRREAYDVTHELLAPLKVVSSGSVRAPADSPVSVDLVSRMDAYSVPVADRTLAFNDIELAVNGRWSAWRVRFGAALTGADLAPARVSVNATGSTTNVNIEQARVASADGATLISNGAIALTANPEWDLRVEASELSLSSLSEQLPEALSARLQTTGRWGSGRTVSADVEMLEGIYRGAPFNAVGAVTWSDNGTQFNEVQVVVGDNTVLIDGGIDNGGKIDGKIDLRAADLSQLLPTLSGSVTANALLGGTRQRLVVDTDLQSASVAWGDLRVNEARGRFEVRGDEVSGNITIADIGFAARAASNIVVSLSGTPASHSLSLEASSVGGVPIELALAGGYEQARWSGTLQRLRGRWPLQDFPLSDIEFSLVEPTALSLAASTYAIENFCLETNLARKVCARAILEDGLIDLQASIEGAPLAALIPVSATGVQWQGEASLTAQLNGPLSALSGTANLTFDELMASKGEGDDRTTLSMNDAALRADLRDGELGVTGGFTLAEGGQVELDVMLADISDPDAPLSGNLSMQSNAMSALNTLLDTFQLTGGSLSANLVVRGTRREPLFESRVDIQSLQVRVIPLGIVLTDVSLSALNDGSTTLNFNGAGSSGEGRFSITGQTSIDPANPFDTRAKVTADQFTFVDLPDRFAVASVDVDLVSSRESLEVTGTMSVDRANILVQGLPEGAVRVSSDEHIVSTGDAVEEDAGIIVRRTIDVTVTLTDEVRLTGFGLKAALGGELRLRERNSSGLQGFGVLDLRDATYSAYGQSLEISRGTIVFNGPLDSPLLDFRAQRQVDETVVGIDILGTPGSLESSLFSTPSLPDAEVFSLLLTGRALGSVGASEGSAMADAAITLGLRQAFGVSSAIRDVVGLDTLTIAGSGRDGRVLAGKQLSPNLYLQYAYGVFDQLSTVLLRLKLNDRLWLESATGDEQYLDLIYSVGRN